MCLVTENGVTRSICTAPVRMQLDFVGAEVDEPGRLTEGYNPVQRHVTARHQGQTLTDQVFLFDTGAQLSVISPAMAETFGLDLAAPEDTISVQGAGGVINDLPGYRIESLAMPLVGGRMLTFENVWVFVIDAAEGLIDGILGMNLFNNAAAMLYDPHHPAGPGLELSFFTESLYTFPFADVEEFEPNGVREEATPLKPGQYGHGAMGTNDVDYWGTPGGSAGDLVFAFADLQNAAPGGDVTLQIIAVDGTVLEADDNDGPGLAAVVAGLEVPAAATGSIYYRVEGAVGSQVSRYELYTAIVDPLDAADEAETVPGTNDAAATATPITRTLTTGTITPGDVDVYSFAATAGTRIVAMLDKDPGRDGLATPARISLLAPDGSELFAAAASDGDGNAAAAGAIAPAPESGTYFVRLEREAGEGVADYRFCVFVLDGGLELLSAQMIHTADTREAESQAAVDAATQEYDAAWQTYFACGGDAWCQLDALVGISDAANVLLVAVEEYESVQPKAGQLRQFAGALSVDRLPDLKVQSPVVAAATDLVTLSEDADTSARRKVADLQVRFGAATPYTYSLAGPDAAWFEVAGDGLYLRAGATLDYEWELGDTAFCLVVPSTAPAVDSELERNQMRPL